MTFLKARRFETVLRRFKKTTGSELDQFEIIKAYNISGEFYEIMHLSQKKLLLTIIIK